MAPEPAQHPLHRDRRPAEVVVLEARARASHPAGRDRPDQPLAPVIPLRPRRARDEDGSMTTEYGLVVVVGATITSIVVKWASGGAIFELLGKILNRVTGLVGL